MTLGPVASPVPPRARPAPWRRVSRHGLPADPARSVAGAAGLVVTLGLLAGCQLVGAGAATEDRQVAAACRAEADRSYLERNRVLLSERSQRDTPFSSSGTVGVTSEGLPQLYGRSGDLKVCLRSHHAAAASAGSGTGMVDP